MLKVTTACDNTAFFFFFFFVSSVLIQNNLNRITKSNTSLFLYYEGKCQVRESNCQSKCSPQGYHFPNGQQAQRPEGRGCAGSCPPQRSSGTGCWTGCTSQLSPERLYSYPQMLCTHRAGWPAGRRGEREEGSGMGGRINEWMRV